MATRHGRLSRTPVSPRDPGVLTAPPAAAASGGDCRAGARTLRGPSCCAWPRDLPGRGVPAGPLAAAGGNDCRAGLAGGLPRRDLAGTLAAERLRCTWAGVGTGGLTPRWRNRITAGLGMLIVLRAVRPGYAWLSGSRLIGVYQQFRRHNQAVVFAELAERASGRGFAEHEAEALNALTRMVIVTGRDLADLGVADILGYGAARRQSGRTVAALPFAYELLRGVGGLSDGPPDAGPGPGPRAADGRRAGGPLPGDLPGRPRRPGPLSGRALCRARLWLAGQPGPDADEPVLGRPRTPPPRHQLAAPARRRHHGWKQRIRTLPDGRPRRTFHTVLFTVRSFYLDLLQWSLEDPARWAQWAAPCPISENDVRGYVKETRRRRARMAERTRALVPVLPRLVAAAEQQLSSAAALLEAARAHAARR